MRYLNKVYKNKTSAGLYTSCLTSFLFGGFMNQVISEIEYLEEGAVTNVALNIHHYRERNIGKIENNVLHVRKSLRKHLHTKTNSFAFNQKLIDSGKFNIVNITIDKNYTVTIPVKIIKERGQIIDYKNSGYEPQYFVPFEYFEGAESIPNSQFNLFKEVQ